MKNLKEFLEENHKDNKELIKDYSIIWKPEDINKWLFESYDEYLENNEYITEEDFYKLKYDNIYTDTPFYWYWQYCLYERLETSLSGNDELFIKLFQYIKGINNIKILNDYIIEIYYDDDFDENSDEFISLLNFGNYFIQSKKENNKLPNPFKIEGKKPKEINYNDDYAYHVTNIFVYDKIKKYGLIPKDKTYYVNHLPRIYMWIKPFNDFIIKAFGRISLYLWKDNIQNNKNHQLFNKIDPYKLDDYLVLLKINLKKFNKDHKTNLKLYGDPAYNKYKSAVFTLENIPTKYIEKIELNEMH